MTSPGESPVDSFSAADDVLNGVMQEKPKEIIETRSRREVFFDRLLVSRDLAILVVAIVLFAIFTIGNPKFASLNNLSDITWRLPDLGLIAVGMTFLFIARELDLSVGSHLAFATTFMAFLVVKRHMDPWEATGLVLLIGVGIGLVNGFAVTKIGVPSFIFTLVGLAALRGLASVVSGGITMMVDDTTTPFYRILDGPVLNSPIPVQFLIMVIVMVIAGFILAKTKFGSDIYATGGDLESARNNGVRTDRTKLICFAVTGGLCALSGVFLFGRLGMAPGDTGSGFELQVIAGIIIGGVGLFGGRGTMFGSFIGLVILVMLTSGLILIGVKEFWDGIVSGLVILVAAVLDLFFTRRAAQATIHAG